MLYAGSDYARVLSCLSRVLGRLCAFPVFAAHSQLLLQDEQLCSGLLQLVLPGISAMAVGLQLPPDRRPPECTWGNATHMAAFMSACLRPMQQQQALVAGPDAGRRLLAAAAQLLQHCPLPAPPAADATPDKKLKSTLFFILQLEAAVLFQYPGMAQQPGQRPSAASLVLPRRQLQLLLAALPRFGEAIAAVAQAPGPMLPHSARIVTAASAVTTLLAQGVEPEADGTGPAAAIESVQDLPAWLHTAAAALRWLPALATISGQEQLLGSGPSTQAHLGQTASAALLLAQRVCCSGLAGMELPDSGWAASSPAVQAECLAGLWELHTAACRVVHSVLAGAIPRQLIARAVPRTPDLFWLIGMPFMTASLINEHQHAAALPSDVAR